MAGLGDVWMTKSITKTTNIICEGELLQMIAQRDAGVSVPNMIELSTPKPRFCETACQLGAADGDDAQRQAAAEYGKACGIAFQIVDDCLDLVGDPEKVGKSLTSDIERGRLTLPFLKVLDLCESAAERDALAQRFLHVDGPEDVETVRKLVVDKGGVKLALAEANEEVGSIERVSGSLAGGPTSGYVGRFSGLHRQSGILDAFGSDFGRGHCGCPSMQFVF